MAATAVFPTSPSRHSSKPSPNTPNAHPYAIKTTSTTLLSRSSSNPVQAANAIHRYVPPSSPSPSPISPTSGQNGIEDTERGAELQKSNSSMGMGRKGKHRYSRSLTDGPMPVPIPPGVINNATSSYTGYSPSSTPSFHVRERAKSLASEPDDDETPRRRPDGTFITFSSSSNMGPPLTPLHRYSNSDGAKIEFSLPEDPKSWSAAQVSGYLTTTLRGAENGEDDVVQTISAYVKTKGIGGRAFLRLSENDFDGPESSLPALARETLLRASRALRRNALRDRMFSSNSAISNGGNLDFNSRHTLSTDNLSGDEGEGEFDGEGVTLRRRAARVRPRTRSRHSSMSSTSSVSSSASGRVRGMVDELERSSSLVTTGQSQSRLDEEGTASSRSSSPTKSSFVRQTDGSPSKHTSGRALPQRPSVNDLFADKEVEAKETDETITRVAKKNVKGREPRLLPFPPTASGNPGVMPGGLLTPAHTGAGYPLPGSPEQQYLQQQYHGPGDYELGFRHAASPHAQTFVVRHGPSPSNLSTTTTEGVGAGSAGKPTRLLPYPPVTAEMALHHPRPRRAVGVGDRDAGGVASESQGEGEELYVTAPEALESSAAEASMSGSSPLGGADDEGGEGEGERSVAELLAAHPNERGSHAVSGAEAWELALGDTVKRVGEVYGHGPVQQPGSTRKARADVAVASQKEIGRRAARAGTGGKISGTVGTGTGRDKGSLRRPGILGLFDEAHDKSAEGVVANGSTAPIKEEAVEGQGTEGEVWKEVIDSPADHADEQRRLEERRQELEAQVQVIDGKSKAIDERSIVVDEMKEEVDAKGREVEERAKDIEERMRKVDDLQIALDIRERSVISREEAVLHRENTIDEEVDLKVQSKAADLDLKTVQRVGDIEAALRSREEALEQRTQIVTVREEAVRLKEESVAERETILRKAEESLQAAATQLDERENGLANAELDLTARELRLQAKKTLGEEEGMFAVVEGNEPPTGAPATPEQIEERPAEQHTGIGIDFLRRCWGTFVLPIVGEERTPAFLRAPSTPSTAAGSSSMSSTSETQDAAGSPGSTSLHKRYRTPTRAIRRDAFLGRFWGGPGGLTDGYLMLMGIGMCVVVLRVLGKRGWAMRR